MYVHDNCLKSVTVIITVTFIIRVALRVAAYFTCSVWDSFPQVVTTQQHQSYELNVTSDMPVSVNDNTTVAETEASVTTDAITTTATTTINTTTETLKRMC